MKITYYVASSLDGYIAKEDGDVSWIDDLGISMEDTDYEEFFSSVDALVMGRKTYEFIYEYGSWPYGDKPVWICTSNEIQLIDGCNLQGGSSPEDVCSAANEKGIKHLWLVGGGKLATSFIEKSIPIHLSICQMPIILGSGIKLFSSLKSPVNVEKVSIQPHKSGLTQSIHPH